jgi:hypothetical protein
MPSSLTFPSTEHFRKKLIARNLSPYTVPGVYTPPPGNITYEVVLRDEGVYNSPDNLISDDPFADRLYPLNAYGPDGGYNKNINAGGLANIQSNLGEYTVMDASLPQQSYDGASWPPFSQVTAEKNLPALNRYSYNEIQIESVGNLQLAPLYSFYANPGPVNFVPSSYSPYQILMQDDPVGSDGSLSQDSFIAQLGAKTLKQEFRERIAQELIRNTIGRVNLANAIGDPLEAISLLQGRRPLIERDWVITRPSNILLEAADFAARLGGFYYPGSVIPGDYFNTDEANLSSFGQISKAFNGGKDPRGGFLGKVFGRFLSQKSPSQLFLNNTGGGQKSALYYNLGYNRYAPDYDKSLVAEVFDKVKGLFANQDSPTKAAYYVGSKQLNASRINSPAGEIPLNPFGQESPSPVYGPDKLAKDFEGENLKFKFGLNGNGTGDNGGTSGGLVWTSPKYNNPGYYATAGGDQGSADPKYNQLVKTKIEEELTQGYEFKQSSILDQTQRIVDSTPGGGKRLSHVGNAINQLSKVFNDGYKEITKGSKVLTYVDEGNGVVVGKEYCRVFSKDVPYMAYSDLQKKDGNIRRFAYSVLNNTYNLNIAPLKSTSTTSSTNIKDGRVQKYMFSIENLAWRTSNRPGLTYLDLPECERGPNGGRIMWFPPYNIKFTESTTVSFPAQEFLGRPEPIYTYKSTSRSGSLSWSIIVDHPSILNIIVEKELKGKSNELINGVIDSFFAGCKKYDIYELAKKYNTIPVSELSALQQIISNPNVTAEDAKAVTNTVVQQTPQVKSSTDGNSKPDFQKWIGIGFYFDNDIPNPNTTQTTSNVNYVDTYNSYTSLSNISLYESKNSTNEEKDQVTTFFNNVVIDNFNQVTELLDSISSFFESNKTTDQLNTTGKIEIVLDGSSSGIGDANYNLNLSKRRISSVQNFIANWQSGKLNPYLKSGQLSIKDGIATGEFTTVTPKLKGGGTLGPFSCPDPTPNLTDDKKIYSVNAMACRKSGISSINASIDPSAQVTPNNNTSNQNGNGAAPGYESAVPLTPTISTTQKIKDGISKKILRSLLTECNYFEMIEEENPMFYDTIKQKIKYFSPAFHAITPEGLNSRLTFLQQCTRPGDTIPIIGTDGKPKYTGAVNTSFGAPPVLVLRIGDFYNTKIIPTQLQIAYDPVTFDMNPEGIGVQPMIANITLNFNFVGGSGLKEPIDKLQNALSFNYYANTEIYDERADWTDDSFKKFDDEILKGIVDNTPVVGVNNVVNQTENDGGTTIGSIESKVDSDTGSTGNITYQKIMDEFLSSGQAYFDIIPNKAEQITKDYNFQIWSAYMQNRNFVDGNIYLNTTPNAIKIVGRPSDSQREIKKLVNKIINDINSPSSIGGSGFQYIQNLYDSRFDNSVIGKVKANLRNAVQEAENGILTALTSVDNEITSIQTDLVIKMRKIDIVTDSHDGFIKTDQKVVVYDILPTNEVQAGSTATDTLVELTDDYSAATSNILTYYNTLANAQIIDMKYDPSNLTQYSDKSGLTGPSCCGQANIRFYAIMCKILLNDDLYNNFINKLIPKDIADKTSSGLNLLDYTKDWFNNFKVAVKEEYDEEQKIIKTFMENNQFKTWTPYNKGKVRKFTFTTQQNPSNTVVNLFKDLYKDGNSIPNRKTFNGKNKLN